MGNKLSVLLFVMSLPLVISVCTTLLPIFRTAGEILLLAELVARRLHRVVCSSRSSAIQLTCSMWLTTLNTKQFPLFTVADRFFGPGGERKTVGIKEQSKKSGSHYSYGTPGGSLGKPKISSKSELSESEKTVGYCTEQKAWTNWFYFCTLLILQLPSPTLELAA